MNGKNKRWLEQRWDRMQPGRLAHIRRRKAAEKPADPARYIVLGYRTGCEIEEHFFEGADQIETHARATRWVDENCSRYDRVELYNAGYRLMYAR